MNHTVERKRLSQINYIYIKLTTQLKIMDIDLDDKKEQYKYLSSAQVLATFYLFSKVHKKKPSLEELLLIKPMIRPTIARSAKYSPTYSTH